MKIRFVGPLGVVTGSCTWLEHAGVEFLIDCGLEQDGGTSRGWTRAPWPFDPAKLRFVVLTHAHADHCGLIPALYRRGFQGVVYCTHETAEIAKIMLRDAAASDDSLSDAADVERIVWQTPPGRVLGERFPVAHDLFLQYFRTGHAMGAVSVQVLWGDFKRGEQRSIMFSGDLGPDAEDGEALPFMRHRMNPPKSDFAVIESTYGHRVRNPDAQDPAARRRRLGELMSRAVDSEGTLLIPAFAFGRVQDLLFDVHWLMAEDPARYAGLQLRLESSLARRLAPVLVAGWDRTEVGGTSKVRPLWLGKQMFRWLGLDDTDPEDGDRAVDICRITLGLPAIHPQSATRGNAIARAWPVLLSEAPPEDRTPAGPRLVIAASGMGDHGGAARWLQCCLTDPATIVAFSGHCADGSVGGQLLRLAQVSLHERRRSRARIEWCDGEAVAERDIRAGITALQGYSGHADQAGLVAWAVSCFRGVHVPAGDTFFIQHGNEQARIALAEAIEQAGKVHGMTLHCVRPSVSDAIYCLDSLHDAGRARAGVPNPSERAELQCQP